MPSSAVVTDVIVKTLYQGDIANAIHSNQFNKRSVKMQDPKGFVTFFKAARTVCALLLMTHLIPVHGTPVVACNSLACRCLPHQVTCSYEGLTELPTGIPNDTYILELWGNKFTSITKTSFAGLSQVTDILLSDNKISSIEVGSFDWQSDTLEQLALNNNELETLQDGVFRNLTKLKYLHLEGNMISSLSGLLRGLSSLESIDLNNNRISALPADVFRGLPLRKLRLARNGILDIDNILAALPANVRTLDLNGNGLGNLRAAMFSGFSNLTQLKLEANGMDSLPENLFLGLDKLTLLHLDDNMLVELNRSSFGDHPKLQRLTVTNNSIVRIEPGFFSTFRELVDINLEGNDLTYLPPGTFDNLDSIEFLNLDGNRLDTLDPNVFRGLQNVWYIYLGENGMKSLPSTIFHGLQMLRYLDLNDNELSVIEDGTFDGLPSIENIYLEDNPLTNITCGMLPTKNVSTSLLGISIDCTCEWKPVYDCPEFSWVGPKLECRRPLRLWSDSLAQVPKDALTCAAPRMMCFNHIGWVALSVLALLSNILISN